eukprot:TRINITY_DN4313_c6_g1_i1.p1 TRINITY_DN4313_c6_g1~~TRINITY_DN4313_c6_g1_i1.p1  ORF type:complete len:495 (-),score=268.41 TRINITY_DN4313_c6_g1_i1:93-1577(-)
MGKGNGKGNGTIFPIQHFVCLMLENRSFDHLLGYLKSSIPQLEGLTGNESNPLDPTNPQSDQAYVSNDAPYITNPDPGHSVNSTTLQVFGTHNPTTGAKATMNGFAASYDEAGCPNYGAAIMQCFNQQTLPSLSSLATNYAVFDHYYASIPGPTQPNRAYLHSATSHGLANNDDKTLALGLPQKSIYEFLVENGYDFRIYYTDFPAALIMKDLRKPANLKRIVHISQYYADCENGTLPQYSFIEPRWFAVLDWQASDEHPPHDVKFGEYLTADVYEALRASPLWQSSALIINYDEHGGLFDHVPTPLENVPNPDGLVSQDPPFNFDRLGVRVPCVVASPWVNRIVVSEPQEAHYEHSSISSTLNAVFNLPHFLTQRDAWAASFEWIFEQRTSPRPDSDCISQLPRPGQAAVQRAYKRSELTRDTLANIRKAKLEKPNHTSALLSDLQREILAIAGGLTSTNDIASRLQTEFEGAIFVRQQLKLFYQAAEINYEF